MLLFMSMDFGLGLIILPGLFGQNLTVVIYVKHNLWASHFILVLDVVYSQESVLIYTLEKTELKCETS